MRNVLYSSLNMAVAPNMLQSLVVSVLQPPCLGLAVTLFHPIFWELTSILGLTVMGTILLCVHAFTHVLHIHSVPT